ncbi:eCIS core domain-containing protein [Roseateles sp. P5_D6]
MKDTAQRNEPDRPSVPAQREAREGGGHLSAQIACSPRQLAQRRVIDKTLGSAVQRVKGELDEEESGAAQLRAESAQWQEGGLDEEDDPAAAQLSAEPAQRQENRTGMPDGLKAGIESLSGMDMSDVRVHHNSSQPAQLSALAYAQGNDIHLGPGQEQHLPHEAWHVVQQRQGRVQATMQMAGVRVNDDVGLEREADLMGGRAMHLIDGGRKSQELTLNPVHPSGGAVLQGLFGFEIEMLVLVDKGGRPVREKMQIGTVAPHLRLDVDHGPAVAAPVPQNLVGAPIASAESVNYDLPVGGVARMEPTLGGDTRLALVNLVPATWLGATAGAEYARGGANGLDNTALGMLDTLVAEYDDKQRNWQAASADARLTSILLQIQAWRAANPTPGALDAAGIIARNLVDATIEQLRVEATAHQVFWNAGPPMPPGMVREYSVPDVLGPGGMTPFTTDHPDFGGMGTDNYASIIEIVTNPYPPETVAGQQDILAAMNAAVAFAGALEVAAGADLAARAPLNGVGGAVIADPTIHFGNALQPAQTTAGSFQTTGAIDLAQFPSFVLSMTAPMPVEAGPEDHDNPNNEYFDLKHHSDDDDHVGDRVRLELPLAVANATTAVNAIKLLGPGAPDMSNLRGLVVMICQYLRMGRHFFGHGAMPLGKNVVPFLSRTDLSAVYERLVPRTGVAATDEKAWLEGIPPLGAMTRLQTLMTAILNATGRAGGSDLFNDDAQSNPGGGWGGSCQNLLSNVFYQPTDIVTNLLGVQTMDAESVDPGAARNGDSRYGGGPGGAAAPQREGIVFEMRNMAKRQYGHDRFPRGEWLKLAEQEIAVARTLNARAEASANHDQRVRLSGYGPTGGPNRTRGAAVDEPNW